MTSIGPVGSGPIGPTPEVRGHDSFNVKATPPEKNLPDPLTANNAKEWVKNLNEWVNWMRQLLPNPTLDQLNDMRAFINDINTKFFSDTTQPASIEALIDGLGIKQDGEFKAMVKIAQKFKAMLPDPDFPRPGQLSNRLKGVEEGLEVLNRFIRP